MGSSSGEELFRAVDLRELALARGETDLLITQLTDGRAKIVAVHDALTLLYALSVFPAAPPPDKLSLKIYMVFRRGQS